MLSNSFTAAEFVDKFDSWRDIQNAAIDILINQRLHGEFQRF